MDILDDILSTLKLKGSLYFRTDFSPPWAVTVPEYLDAARFHFVIQGRCCVKIEGQETLELGPGDLVLIPRGASHILSHTSVKSAPPLETVLEDAAYDGNGVLRLGTSIPDASTQMVCGHLTFRKGADHPILNTLPSYAVTSASMRAKRPLLDETLRLIARCVFTDDLGSTASVTRLSEIVFIEMLRSDMGLTPEMQSLLEAFRDPKVGQSLQLIHSTPSENWTVESLASEVAMSRSRFAKRFSELIGIGPMSYLSDWRLQKALSLLDNSQLNVQQVADQTGYRSASAFSRAFSGKFGFTPRDYRRPSR